MATPNREKPKEEEEEEEVFKKFTNFFRASSQQYGRIGPSFHGCTVKKKKSGLITLHDQRNWTAARIEMTFTRKDRN